MIKPGVLTRPPSPGPTSPLMPYTTRRYQTGSVVAQDKKDRVPDVNSPTDTTSSLDYINKTNENLSIGTQIITLSLNIEGISMAKCEYLAQLLSKQNADIVLL